MFIKAEDMKVLHNDYLEQKKSRLEERVEYYIKEYGYTTLDTLAHYLKSEGHFKFSLPVKGGYMKDWKVKAEEIKEYFEKYGYFVSIERNDKVNRKWVSYWIEIILV